MRKNSLLFRSVITLLLFISVLPSVCAEFVQEPTQYVIMDGPSSRNELAFGSVCILNGCHTVDGYVPLGGSDRKLDSAQSVFAFERNTGTLIYSYNADTRVSPGGLAKLVNALVVIEHCEMEDIVTVSSRNVSRLPGGSINVDLRNDEQLTVGDLLHCMIMQGANDAAIVLAEHVAGNLEAFTALMNQRVRQMGCTGTEFGNVHGLDTQTSSTTARDMCRIMLEGTRNEIFNELISATSYTVPETNKSKARKFESQDYLVDSKNIQKFYDKRVVGGMQSASTKSGASIVFTAKERNMDVVFVVMGCTRQLYDNGWQVKVYGNFEEAQALLNYVFNTYKACRILYDGQALKQFAVSGGENNVVAEPHLDIDSVLPADAHMNNLLMEYKDTGLKAPISQGDMVGTVEVWYRNTCLMEAELYAMGGVRLAANSGLNILGGADRNDSESKFSLVMMIISLVVLIPVGGYLVINAFLRYRRRAIIRERKRQKARRFY